MSKSWDSDKGGRRQWVAWFTEVMEEALRVIKPGAHAFVWALPRTSHWTAWALEDAGWEIRDRIAHIAGSGFPKSLNVQSAAQKAGLACKCQEYEVQYPVDESLPILREDTSQEATESATQVLLNEMHGPGKTNLANRKDVSVVRQEVGAQDTLSSRSQQDLQPKVRCETGAADISNAEEATSDLPELRTEIRTEEQYGHLKGEVLFVPVRGHGEIARPEDACPPQGDRQQWQGQETSRQGDGGRKESGLEGRSNLQAWEGQLQRTEVREMPAGILADGSQGRIHHGAPSRDGEVLETPPGENGSGASHRPRSEEQHDREPSALQQQWGTQTCGRCGKAVLPEGLGTALKPAVEDWWLVRKPFSEKTVAKQVLSTGTGALNIDGSRIGTGGAHGGGAKMSSSGKTLNSYGEYESDGFKTSQQGRWPANVLISHHERCQRVGVKRIRPSNGSARAGTPKPGKKSTINAYGEYGPRPETVGFTHTDPDGYEEVEAWECVDGCPVEHLGEPARFFYVAKASRAERGEGNTHPCVKPLALMSYLIKLATPPGGVVLDPFMGSGTTGVACVEEGFDFIGIEQNLEYLTIAQRRIEWATLQAGQHVLPRSPSIPRVNGKVDTELQGSLWRDSVSSGKE